MEVKRTCFKHTVLVLVVAWIATSEAAPRPRSSNKFDFPLHLRGTNHSAMHELIPYLQYNPVDLGVDILDDEAPMHIRKALANATLDDDPALNQITDNDGWPRLRKAIAKLYGKLIGQELDPDENVLVTSGATEAVYLSFQGHTSPGDEWIVIEPAYTMYIPQIKLAHGVPKFTTLKVRKTSGKISGDDWLIDREEMESLFTNRTKGILINNPLNPLGKMYKYEELEFVASMAKKYNTIVVADEAHEWITWRNHIRIASLPGMYERTITIGSSSKSFSVAGWRIGWAYGPSSILNHLKTVHQRAVDSCPTPQQDAIAYGFEQEYINLGKPYSYFATHARSVQEKMEYLKKTFYEVGMMPIDPNGGYCMLANWTTLKNVPVERGPGSAMKFVKWMIVNVGVLGLPAADFFGNEHRHFGEHLVRFCFHKKDETLMNAVKNLQKLKNYR